MKIDVGYNFQKETEPLDSDKYSKTLQEYHRILWSKQLPNGKDFTLSKTSINRLIHKSDLGEFILSSDRAVSTYRRWIKTQNVISQVPKDQLEYFNNISNTIGGIIVWPSNQVDKKFTINASRGINKMIADRLDITIECLRRYYQNEESPLYETFKRYSNYFDLFTDFKGFVDFFLFNDYVTDDYKEVKIAKPFDNFQTYPIPNSVDEYMDYMNHMINLTEARNIRIDEYYNK